MDKSNDKIDKSVIIAADGTQLEQLTINPPDSSASNANFIQNNTENSPKGTTKADEIAPIESNGENAKTGDPVSVIGTLEKEKAAESFISDEDDNLLFSKLFPGVLRENVEKDEKFKLFARTRVKNAPFTVIYSDFRALVDKISAEADEKHAISLQNALSSPGSLASGEAHDDSFFTKEQVLKMSKEQIAKNYQKIRQSQQRW